MRIEGWEVWDAFFVYYYYYFIFQNTLVLNQKSSSGNNGHLSNSLGFENYFIEKSSLIYKNYKVQLCVTFQISIRSA